MKVQPPCGNCENREVGCHSTCESYKKYTEEKDNYKNQMLEIKKKNNLHRDFVISQLEKNRRAHR